MRQELRNLTFFLSFSYYNVEDTVTNFDKDVFKKDLSMCKIFKGKANLKASMSSFVLQLSNHVFFLSVVLF